ncbi:DNA polymerase III subunit gamma/tau [Alteromonas sp. 009811495]|uniref:DNA polymerase III subunit gamma/tau n=1 Tax=Alteromonas sp. 009811495 TaxID=3002962 RepID=UPI00237DEF66|nr:DNA polymerase III subunit gamma/tau [Alteromonas sp. 009811495]WDT84839.1 DNA polymerase III subunit gamma/tau [Alteromonas sp. 009811495]
MSYQVLARKWRPGKFSELVGQEHVVSAISNALDNDRLHHAYLFTGTRGVGKTTIARIFSKSLNCEEGQGANPCGQCNTCKEIEQGNYVDLLEIDAASRTKVEDTRELLDNVQYKPTRGRYKVYLIDEVHMLSKHSFNALLKTLEEPPPHVKFLLATTDPQKLPITILSRCLQFNLKAMSREQIVGQLSHILEHEQLPFEPQALALLARAAQGSMRDALSLTDQAIAQGGNQVVASIVTDMLGLMDKNQLLKVIHAVVSKSPADVLQLVNDIAEQAPDYDNVHGELASLLHQIALTQWVPEACKLETTSAKAIYQLAKTIPAEQVQLLYQIALQGRKDLPFAADGKSAFEMTLMRMMTFAPSAPLADTASDIASGNSNVTLPISGNANANQSSSTISPPDPSGGPGNVSKQEDTHASETSATSIKTQDVIDDSHVVSDETETPVNPQPDEKSENDALETPLPQAMVSEQATSNQVMPEVSQTAPESIESDTSASVGFDGPPLDAYMDDMPASSDDDVDYGIDNIDLPVHTEAKVPEEHNSSASTNALSAEEQLTSTADMLALRQKLKQRKAEDAESKTADGGANSGLTSAEEIQARFVKTATPSALDNELSVSSEGRESSADAVAETSVAGDSTAQDVVHVTNNATTLAKDDLPSAVHQNAGQNESTNQPQLENDFSFDEFDSDAPYANEPSASAPFENEAQAPNFEQDSNEVIEPQNLQKGDTASAVDHDLPPWESQHSSAGHSDSSNELPPHWENDLPVESTAPQVYDNTMQGHGEEQTESSDADFACDAFDFDTPLATTYNGSLKAYLNDGNKLTHASQIDSWSQLVEQMPVAGLLKQLVLHASFVRNGNTVSLEIDHSQSHLLNDSTKQQLIDAMHHGLVENVNVDITLGEPSTTPFALQQEIHAMRHAHAHTVVNTDDTIQALLSTFDASVLTDTVKAR